MKLDLTPYNVPFERVQIVDGQSQLVKGEEEFPLRLELYELLRLPGLFQDGIAVVDAVLLARRIRDCAADSVELDAAELKLLKQAMNKLIDRPHNPSAGQMALGGPRYEELILRVFGS